MTSQPTWPRPAPTMQERLYKLEAERIIGLHDDPAAYVRELRVHERLKHTHPTSPRQRGGR